jgi:hypothetical protein
MKSTKQGVRDLNPPGGSNMPKTKVCIHKWGARTRVSTGYSPDLGDYPIFGRPCLNCPEYQEEIKVK